MTQNDRKKIKRFLQALEELKSVDDNNLEIFIDRFHENNSHNIKLLQEYSEKMSGRSTRLIDEYIQKLFNESVIMVEDHYNTREADRKLFDRIVSRLLSEHSGIKFGHDRNRCMISLNV